MILDGYKEFVEEILNKLNSLGVYVSDLDMDHIGYQASSVEDYKHLKQECEKVGRFVSEEIVNGRRVAIYKLHEALKVQHYALQAIELIEPKTGQMCPSALEHVEFVLPDGFDAFLNLYPTVNWDTSSLNQPKFPMLKLKLSEYTQVKFHLEPVLKIVE
jgi:uncharacterized protein